jgi:hypothetical protein
MPLMLLLLLLLLLLLQAQAWCTRNAAQLPAVATGRLLPSLQ